ncbi:MAG: UDP-N-acetylmuramoyl-tripeptide--D-alanyl-D-alanine ligase [Alphaproteobacteria bacterium]|nr:MAG: UDP-N-acetylmuramoyl-tripeptide--D-alanyl-D-alanine ligase [Alphaproteobacteria bacterium]
MTALWTSAALAEALGIPCPGAWSATGLSIDSRTVQPGDLFVALPGERTDGHAHVAAALAAGAVGALVSQLVADAPVERQLMVADTLAGLQDIAAAARHRSSARTVAVTGSVGKTSTKEMLLHTLGAQGATHASLGNLNNHIGAPLSLARLPVDATFAVFELGMNHPGEISPLSRLVQPEAAIITWVAAAHLEFFADEGGIADEKATILDGLRTGGVAVLPRDCLHFERLAQHADARAVARIASFGADASADVRLMDVVADADGSTVAVDFYGETLRYRIGVPGRPWVSNSLAVLAAVDALGGDAGAAAAQLETMTPPKGRGVRQVIPWGNGHVMLVDESYNASPAAVRAAIATLALAPAQRRIVVLGDMKELGPTAPALHAGLAHDLGEAGIDHAFLCGPLMAELATAARSVCATTHEADTAALIPVVVEALRPGDAVLVKGSLSMGMARVVQAIATGRIG